MEAESSIKEELIYHYDEKSNDELLSSQPWKQNSNYFQGVKISYLSLMKMLRHSEQGGSIEIMGVLTGKVIQNQFYILDAIPLPVEGTETRVNAGSEANEYIIDYLALSTVAQKLENVVGWYHSHPGYSCWLSGIDIQTQRLYQLHQDPFVALVIDPFKSLQESIVELKAFRTYNGDVNSPQLSKSQNLYSLDVPENKLEDFGIHWRSYYELRVELFGNERDKVLIDEIQSYHWEKILPLSHTRFNGNVRKCLMGCGKKGQSQEELQGRNAIMRHTLEDIESDLWDYAMKEEFVGVYRNALDKGISDSDRQGLFERKKNG